MATIFHHLGIDPQTQFVNQAGRPEFVLEQGQLISNWCDMPPKLTAGAGGRVWCASPLLFWSLGVE